MLSRDLWYHIKQWFYVGLEGAGIRGGQFSVPEVVFLNATRECRSLPPQHPGGLRSLSCLAALLKPNLTTPLVIQRAASPAHSQTALQQEATAPRNRSMYSRLACRAAIPGAWTAAKPALGLRTAGDSARQTVAAYKEASETTNHSGSSSGLLTRSLHRSNLNGTQKSSSYAWDAGVLMVARTGGARCVCREATLLRCMGGRFSPHEICFGVLAASFQKAYTYLKLPFS